MCVPCGEREITGCEPLVCVPCGEKERRERIGYEPVERERERER